VVLVDTKKRLRLKRLEGRGVDKKRAKKIMSVQVPIKELKRWSDVILVNNGTVDEIEKKAIFIAEALAL
jgi:dephospho-CoA kinase